jgi:radical SAM superfamily enzyme YgiQ (UPF0313 family)
MPYSLTMMHAVLKSEIDEQIISLDLNAWYHHKRFNEFYTRMKTEDYFELLEEFVNKTRSHYQKLSKACLSGENPEGHDELLKEIMSKEPDAVAISFIYNSQAFFAKGIIDALIKNNVKVIIGGPGDFSIIKGEALVLQDYLSLVKYLVQIGAKTQKKKKKAMLDFSMFNKEDYFTKEIVYSLRTANSCPYKRCTFCTHHGNMPYSTIELSFIKEAIIKNKMKKIYFIDDCFTIPRLEELCSILEPLKVSWWCQLRPTKEIIPLFPKLKKAGLRSVNWGIESGCQRVLDFMQKGTTVTMAEQVLKEAKKFEIKNMVYIMFGLPTETKEEFMETLSFLKRNKASIDLISTSTFGLQKGSRIYSNPENFGVKKIIQSKRILFGDKIEYIPVSGMTQEEAETLKNRYKGEIGHLNKMPKAINACREQVLNYPV